MRRFLFILILAAIAQPAYAQIAFGALGGSSAGTTSITVLAPTGIAAGNMLVICLSTRQAPTTPSGWTLVGTQSGGSGADGADTGTVHATVYTKVSDGTETDTAVAVSGGTGGGGRMIRYTKTNTAWSASTASKGSDNTAGTDWSVTGDVDQGVTTGDFVVSCSATNNDLYTHVTPSISQTGVTFSSQAERIETPTTLGNDSTVYISEHVVSGGPSSAAPVYTMTASGTATDNPAGATVIVRLREEAAATGNRKLLLTGVGDSQ